MKLLSKITVFVGLVSAQNQQCMDKCGQATDKCHETCNDFNLEEYCHDSCRQDMCLCFRACGCPECCGYSKDTVQNEMPLETDKINVSQFLKKRTSWNN